MSDSQRLPSPRIPKNAGWTTRHIACLLLVAALNAAAILLLGASIFLGLNRVSDALVVASSIRQSGAMTSSSDLIDTRMRQQVSYKRAAQLRQSQTLQQAPVATGLQLPTMDVTVSAAQPKLRKSGSGDSPVPSDRALSAARQSEAPLDGKVLFAVVASYGRRQLIKEKLGALCTLQWAQCSLYVEDGSAWAGWGHPEMPIVLPSMYMNGTEVKQIGDCCGEPSVGNPSASRFFCDPHRSLTLNHQYRFLPALSHARLAHLAEWRSGTLAWLALIDDDATVNPGRMLSVLQRHRSGQPSYLGDFGPWTQSLTRISDERRSIYGWNTPYACGGSGSIISRAGILKTDFAQCTRFYHRGCYQSDWMIGQCLGKAGVLPVVQQSSCGVCLPCTLKPGRLRQQLDILTNQMHHPGEACGFALFPKCEGPQITTKFRELRQGLCDVVLQQAAVTHGEAHACNRNATVHTTQQRPQIRGPTQSVVVEARMPGARGEVNATGRLTIGIPVQKPKPSIAAAASVVAKPSRSGAGGPKGGGGGPKMVKSFLAQHGLLNYAGPLLWKLGVHSLNDLHAVTDAELREVLMPDAERSKLLASLRAIPNETLRIDPNVRLFVHDGPLMSVLRQLHLLKARIRFIGKGPGQLGVKSLKDLVAINDEQLKMVNLRPISRRVFLAAMEQLKADGHGKY